MAMISISINSSSGTCFFCPVLQQRKKAQVEKLLELLSVSGGRFPFQGICSCIERLCVYCHIFLHLSQLCGLLCAKIQLFPGSSVQTGKAQKLNESESRVKLNLCYGVNERENDPSKHALVSLIYMVYFIHVFGWSNTYYMSFAQKSPLCLVNIYVKF